MSCHWVSGFAFLASIIRQGSEAYPKQLIGLAMRNSLYFAGGILGDLWQNPNSWLRLPFVTFFGKTIQNAAQVVQFSHTALSCRNEINEREEQPSWNAKPRFIIRTSVTWSDRLMSSGWLQLPPFFLAKIGSRTLLFWTYFCDLITVLELSKESQCLT